MISQQVGLVLAQQWQDRLAGVEAELMARQAGTGVNHQAKRRMAGASSTRSSREAERRTRRADAVAENPQLGDALTRGDLGTGQLDAIADASAKSDGAAATDQHLIEQVSNANPDQAHRRERRRRRVRSYETSRGTWALQAEGDKVSIDEMSRRLDALADAAHRADGGRELPADQHPRTADHRRYDALYERLVGPSRAAAAGPTKTHLAATVDDLSGSGIDPADVVGSGPLPHLVLERSWCNAEVIGSIDGSDGQPLWQGRSVRTATAAQIDALIARDRGCVLCGADPSRCEAHHLVPFGAPAGGRTDIDQLVLVCGPCHHLVHDNHLTIVRHPDGGAWTTRPATTPELPAPSRPRQRSP